MPDKWCFSLDKLAKYVMFVIQVNNNSLMEIIVPS